MRTVLHELEIFRNYHVTDCRKIVLNAIYQGWAINFARGPL